MEALEFAGEFMNALEFAGIHARTGVCRGSCTHCSSVGRGSCPESVGVHALKKNN
jgi:hypothetical protein